MCVSDFSVSVQGVLGGRVHGATLALGCLSQAVLLGVVELGLRCLPDDIESGSSRLAVSKWPPANKEIVTLTWF